MFSVNQSVTLQVESTLERISARVIQASPAHLVVELLDRAFPPIDERITVLLESGEGAWSQPTTVSGHWQHSKSKTIELARVGRLNTLRPQRGAA